MDWKKLNITIEQLIEVWDKLYGENIQEEHPSILLKLVEVSQPK